MVLIVVGSIYICQSAATASQQEAAGSMVRGLASGGGYWRGGSAAS